MNTPIVPALLGFTIVCGGCGTGAPPTTKAPESAATTAAAVTPMKAPIAPTADTPTASVVAIDPAIQKACGISANEALFAFDSAKVQPGAEKLLDSVVTCFLKGPLKGRSLRLVGRADPRGESEYNLSLGQSRADAIAHYLSVKGLDSAHQSATSRGAMDAMGKDEPGWAKDRRVDLLLAP